MIGESTEAETKKSTRRLVCTVGTAPERVTGCHHRSGRNFPATDTEGTRQSGMNRISKAIAKIKQDRSSTNTGTKSKSIKYPYYAIPEREDRINTNNIWRTNSGEIFSRTSDNQSQIQDT